MAEIIDEEMVKVGERIRECRIEKGMNQADLAEKANLSLPHISSIEHGKKYIRTTTLVSIAEALQVSTDYLLRPNIPAVTNIYKGEFNDLLKDCSNDEIASITKIVKEIKNFMRSKK